MVLVNGWQRSVDLLKEIIPKFQVE